MSGPPLEPNDLESLYVQGVALQNRGQLSEARACYQRALELRPGDVTAQFNLATAWHEEGRESEAEACYRAVLGSDPAHHGAQCGLGAIYMARGELSALWELQKRMLERSTDDVAGQFFRAVVLLTRGEFAEGWRAFESRLDYSGRPRRAFDQPRWDGSPLGDRTLLVHAEYGLGDTLQFLRYVPLVAERNPAASIVVEVYTQLIPLLSQAGFTGLVAKGSPLPRCDVQIPLLSLPGLLGTTLETIPAEAGYLAADDARVRAWQSRLASTGGFRVGINWQGNAAYPGDRHRSIPLTHFARVAAVPGVSLVSLQKQQGTEQLAAAAGQFPVLTLDGLDEQGGAFLDTAAVMKNLDLVITSDSAVAHLAGALDVPVWVVLSSAPDWRWLRDRDTSPWYPTMRLFRQTRLDDWDEVFSRVAAELSKQLAEERPCPRP